MCLPALFLSALSYACRACVQALQREYAGPVTALECLRGYLVMAIGTRVEMHYKQVRC